MSRPTRFQHPAAGLAGALAFGISLALCGPVQAAGLATLSGIVGQASSAAALPANLDATDIVVNLAGIKSYDDAGATINTVLQFGAQPGAVVDQLSWTLTLATIGDSWLSEAGVRITNSDGDGVAFNPGSVDDLSGTQTYTFSISLVSDNLSFSVLADGKLFVEFYDHFDDYVGAADATYLSGNITIAGIAAAVPEPASYGLMGLGLVGLAQVARRRRLR